MKSEQLRNKQVTYIHIQLQHNSIGVFFSLLESHTAEPKLQPCYQPKSHCKNGENNSSLYHEKEAGRKTSFYYSEPQTSAYVVNWIVTVTKEPKFSGPTGVFLLQMEDS